MTREEAMQIIADWLVSSKGEKGQCGYIEGWFYKKDVEAFQMAIEALEQETVPIEDCIDRYSALAELDPLSYEYKEIKELPSVVPKRGNEDLISRQDALDAIAKFVPYVIDDMSTESYTNGLKDAYNLIHQLPKESEEE